MSETDQTPEKEVQFSPGSLLKQARERAGISIEEVTQKLKLTRQTIANIESDDYSTDLPVTFYRGYLRNYAELLKVDHHEIVENFDNFCKRNNLFKNTEQSLATIELEKPINSSNWLVKAFTTLIILVLLFGVYYLLAEKKIWQKITSAVNGAGTEDSVLILDQDKDNQLPISDTPSRTSEVTETPETTASQKNVITGAEDELSTEAAPVEQTQPTDTSDTADSKPVYTSGELVLVFTDDCWVRITDANGKVMALGIKKGGTSISLSGVEPIELTLGKPSAVQLSYQSEPIDLSSYPDTRAARLTLGN